MTTADAHTLTGAYALHAVTDLERAAFTRHLAECATCSQEVAELQETAARLGAAMSVDPGSRLRDRVLREVAATRQIPPAVATGTIPRRTWRKRTVVSIAAVAAAAAVFAGGIGLATVYSDPGPAQMAEPLAAPDLITVHAGSAASGTATVNFSRQRGEAIITAHGLPPLVDGRAYQFWLSGPRGKQSAGLLHAGSGTIAAPLASDIDHVAITVEPATGSPQPTTSPVRDVPLGTH
ncbi:anti-sigma factor [Amycolatopsis sp. NPDC089917]|uniref:anti-sigma factor n=1 Tax=Amycolatopsis sp. NPDC089917 TaxID=3155187 RepID=UPI003416285B